MRLYQFRVANFFAWVLVSEGVRAACWVLCAVGLMSMFALPLLKAINAIPYKGNCNHRDEQQAKCIHVYSFLSR